MQKMVTETYAFEIALYLGRIKTGPKPYDDDVFAALIHNNVTKGFGFRALKTMVKSEGYADFWGTDKILPTSGTQGEHTKEEKDDAFAKLQGKLHGNPEVLKERYVTFLEFAEICFRKDIFKKESNLKIVQKALAVKKKEDAEKGMIEKARTKALTISPELAATFKQGELQLMNVVHLDIGAEVEVGGNKDVGNKTTKVTKTVKQTKTTKIDQTLDLAEIDGLVMKEYQVGDMSELHLNNMMKYREMSIKLQKDNLVLMKTNDRQAKEIKMEKKATVDHVGELIDDKIKPIVETLKDLPRQIKLMVEEVMRIEKVSAEARCAEKVLADEGKYTKLDEERNSMMECTQDMVREIYNYVKPVDITQFESPDEETPVKMDSVEEEFESNSGIEEVFQTEEAMVDEVTAEKILQDEEVLVDETTAEEVTVLEDLYELEKNEASEKSARKEFEADPSTEKTVLEGETKPKPDEDKEGRKISVVINKSRNTYKSDKRNRRLNVQVIESDVIFKNSDRMFNSLVTPRREIQKMTEVPGLARPSRWSQDCTTPQDGWDRKRIEERRKTELMEATWKKREMPEEERKDQSMLEAQRLEKRDVEESRRRTERGLRERDIQETRRKDRDPKEVLGKGRDVKETQRKEKELLEARNKEIELKETRIRKETELFETQKKEKEIIESRKSMAKELEEVRRKEDAEKEKRRERDVRMMRTKEELSRDDRRGGKKQGEESRTVTFKVGEDQVEWRKDAKYEPSGWPRERRERSPRAKRALGGRFKRCRGSVVYYNLIILLGNVDIFEGFSRGGEYFSITWIWRLGMGPTYVNLFINIIDCLMQVLTKPLFDWNISDFKHLYCRKLRMYSE